MAGALGVAVGPEVGRELVAADALLRSGEESEQGEGLALGGRAGAGNPVICDGQSAKRPEFQYPAPFDPFLTRSLRPASTLARVHGECHCARRTAPLVIKVAAVQTRMELGGTTKDTDSTRRDLRSEEHTSELQSLAYLVCRLLLEKKNYSDR